MGCLVFHRRLLLVKRALRAALRVRLSQLVHDGRYAVSSAQNVALSIKHELAIRLFEPSIAAGATKMSIIRCCDGILKGLSGAKSATTT